MSRFRVGDVVVLNGRRVEVQRLGQGAYTGEVRVSDGGPPAVANEKWLPEDWLPDPEPRVPEFTVGQAVRHDSGVLAVMLSGHPGGVGCLVLGTGETHNWQPSDLSPVTLVERPGYEETVDRLATFLAQSSYRVRADVDRAHAGRIYDLLFGEES